MRLFNCLCLDVLLSLLTLLHFASLNSHFASLSEHDKMAEEKSLRGRTRDTMMGARYDL